MSNMSGVFQNFWFIGLFIRVAFTRAYAYLSRMPGMILVLTGGLTLMTGGCGQNRQDLATDTTKFKHVEDRVPQQSSQQDFQTERKQIREGEIEFQTRDLSRSRQVITQIVARYQGYIASENLEHFRTKVVATLIVRVPAMYFDSLVNAIIAHADHLKRIQIDVKDVTGQWIDVHARLKAKKELESRYLGLLARAKSVEELLEIEKELARIRADIERLEQELKQLETRIAYSTLTITLYERTYVTAFRKALYDGWNVFLQFLSLIVYVWPFVLSAIILLALIHLVQSLMTIKTRNKSKT